MKVAIKEGKYYRSKTRVEYIKVSAIDKKGRSWVDSVEYVTDFIYISKGILLDVFFQRNDEFEEVSEKEFYDFLDGAREEFTRMFKSIRRGVL